MGLGLTFEEFHWDLLIVPVCKELGGILCVRLLDSGNLELRPLLLSTERHWEEGWLNSKLVSTHLWNTPRATFTKRLMRDIFHIWPGGLPGVCSRGVLTQP